MQGNSLYASGQESKVRACVRARSALCCDAVLPSGTDAGRLYEQDGDVQALVKV